jgi:hypothetical protein
MVDSQGQSEISHQFHRFCRELTGASQNLIVAARLRLESLCGELRFDDTNIVAVEVSRAAIGSGHNGYAT